MRTKTRRRLDTCSQIYLTTVVDLLPSAHARQTLLKAVASAVLRKRLIHEVFAVGVRQHLAAAAVLLDAARVADSRPVARVTPRRCCSGLLWALGAFADGVGRARLLASKGILPELYLVARHVVLNVAIVGAFFPSADA